MANQGGRRGLMRYHAWNISDVKRILELYPTHSVGQMAEELNLSVWQVDNMIRKIRDTKGGLEKLPYRFPANMSSLAKEAIEK